jgi:hypothetical protein
VIYGPVESINKTGEVIESGKGAFSQVNQSVYSEQFIKSSIIQKGC